MNILITGGCGFIGINLIQYLFNKDRNYRIRVIDNLSIGTRNDLSLVCDFVELEKKEIREKINDNVELIVGDIMDAALAKDACKGIDAVVHLAANTGVIPSIEDPYTDCTKNVIGTLNYLDAARLSSKITGSTDLNAGRGVRKFIFASSGAPLGEQKPPIHEEMVARPVSPYGASKLSGEAYCSAYYRSFDLDTVALRFGNVYGPYSSHKGSVVAKFIKHILAHESLTIYGDGTQTRDFVYIADLVEAIVLSLNKSNIGGEIFQIATQREHTVAEVAKELNQCAEQYLKYMSEVVYKNERKGEVRRNFSDISKARKMLGFKPKFDLARGLKETFIWFMENIN